MFDTLIKKILSARVYDVAIETPVHQAPFLSKRLGRPVLLKREDLQPVYSFKCRGAYNKMVGIPKDVLSEGCDCGVSGESRTRGRSWRAEIKNPSSDCDADHHTCDQGAVSQGARCASHSSWRQF